MSRRALLPARTPLSPFSLPLPQSPRSQPDGACFAAPRAPPPHPPPSLPYAASAPALSALSAPADDRAAVHDCYARTVRRLRLCAPRSQPVPVPRARAAPPPAAAASPADTPPLPDAAPIVARFVRVERARLRGEQLISDPFVEWSAVRPPSSASRNPFVSSPASPHIVPGRPSADDGFLRRPPYFDY